MKLSKKKLMREWAGQFPELSIIRGKLLRRTGPLVQGIAVQLGADLSYYRPVAFVHVLLRESPNVSLGLPIEIRNEYFTEVSDVGVVARRLREECDLSFEGDLAFDDVVAHYKKYYETNPYYFVLSDLEDIALMMSLLGLQERVGAWIDFATGVIRGWPERVTTSIPAPLEWADSIVERARDIENLRNVVASEIEKHGLPTRSTAELKAD